MEEISLAALPVGTDEDDGDGNRDSDIDGSVSGGVSHLSRSTETRDADINITREVLESSSLLGPDHPHTITSTTKLASAYWKQGRLDEAHLLDLRVLEARTGMAIEVDETPSMGDETQRVFYIGFRDALEELERATSELAERLLQERLYDVLRYCDPLTVKLALLQMPPEFAFSHHKLVNSAVSNQNYGGSVIAALLDIYPHPVMLTPEVRRCIFQNEKFQREVWDVILAKHPEYAGVYSDFDALMLEAGPWTPAGGAEAQLTAPGIARMQTHPEGQILFPHRVEPANEPEPQSEPETEPSLSIPWEPLQRYTPNPSIVSAVSSASQDEIREARRRREVIDQGRRTWLAPKPQESVQDELKPKSRLIAKPASSRYARRTQAKIFCKHCDEYPNGFRGAHELQRHVSSKHPVTDTKWICRDPASVGIVTMRPVVSLEGCKNCKSKKQYGAYYNATAHLRRIHFTPKHSSGGTWPSMDTLKLWLEEVKVKQPEPQVHSEGTNESPPFLGDSLFMLPNPVEFAPENPVKGPLEHSGMQSSSTASSNQVYEEIHVPHSAISLIMGESGETIKQLQHTTGCKVKVIQMPDALPENTMREIALIGSRDSIMLAKQAIVMLAKQAIGEKVAEVVRRPSYLSSARHVVKSLY